MAFRSNKSKIQNFKFPAIKRHLDSRTIPAMNSGIEIVGWMRDILEQDRVTAGVLPLISYCNWIIHKFVSFSKLSCYYKMSKPALFDTLSHLFCEYKTWSAPHTIKPAIWDIFKIEKRRIISIYKRLRDRS